MVNAPLRTAALAALLATTASCVGEPEPGEYGRFRYVGNVQGDVPLPLLPPFSDRVGNAYVLYGAGEPMFGMSLFMGGALGGWKSCELTKNIETQVLVHGFIGRSENRIWYWSGEALVGALGEFGSCYPVLDTFQGSQLLFKAVVPWVRETPSRLTTLAMIQTQTDPLPFTAVIDLERNVFTDAEEFGPSNAADVEVLGTGGNVEEGEGVFVVRYRIGESIRTEAQFFNFEGAELETVDLKGLDMTPAYGFAGFIKSDDEGLYAGLDASGTVHLFDKSGASRETVSGMTPVGIQKWDGKLYVVGTNNGKPRIAPITTDGDIGDASTWDASEAAQDNLPGELDVVDDRSLPSRDTTFDNPRSALGPHIFVHSHQLDHHADGVTSWLFAGPSFAVNDVGGGDDQNAIAHVNVGIRFEE